ncbi:serine O-acetyltransferase [Roseomonas sp. 18066]|uniref:serine O-acetyltransferase n=1 Tax=Roseomonas sp. 18066 TaxID=2681412 RepID=UPI001358BC9C|nr:serine acetyltransferase [Roseomonas sp. 18066]
MSLWPRLQEEAAALAARVPALAAGLGETALASDAASGLAGLLRRLVPGGWVEIGPLAQRSFAEAPDDVAAALADLDAITRLNFEPGGLVGTWLGGRGFHMLVAHRLAHRLWMDGETELAIAVKTGAAILGADIHPAARLGRGLFLDHGIGLVVGETAVIEDGVCLWHGVTLGSTLMADGDRHPKIRRGAVLGAGATILGNIEVGEAAVVASGSVVLRSVPPRTTVAGNPAVQRGQHRHPYPQHLAALEIAA